MPNAIPTKRRDQVKARENNRCLRCPAQGTAWHHRRRRRVGGDHQHCSCNGVWLCKTCHDWSHSNPAEAQRTGFIVSTSISDPGIVPVAAFHGQVILTCEGTYSNGESTWHE